MRQHLKNLCLFIALLLAACGGGSDGGSGSSPASSVRATVSSNVVKGIIQNGMISVSQWQNGAYVQIDSTTTDSSGNFSVTLPAGTTGYLKLDLGLSTSSTPTTMICDAQSCTNGTTTVSFGQSYQLTTNPGISTWAVVDSSGNVTVMPMTAISTFVVQYADAVGGYLSQGSVTLAENRVALVLGLELTDLMAHPGDLTNSTYTDAANAAGLKLSLLSAAFAQLADTQGADVSTIISNYVQAFVNNGGNLLQASSTNQPSVAGLLTGAVNVASASVVSSAPNTSQALQAINNTLSSESQTDTLSNVTGNLNTAAALSNLGPLGVLVEQQITAENSTTLAQLIQGQLSQFGWMTSADSQAIATVTAQVIVYTVISAAELSAGQQASALFPNGQCFVGSTSATPGTFSACLNFSNKTLTVTGTESGVTANLTINLTAITAGSHANPFVYSAVGTLTTANETASINGSLTIDPLSTDMTPLDNAVDSYLLAIFTNSSATSATQSLETAIATLLQSGSATFTVNGSASIASGTSTLGVSGKGSLTVNMAGDSSTSPANITASGSADGTLTLPNGMQFSSDPTVVSGNQLIFSLDQDGSGSGSFNTQFTATNFLKLPTTQVTASGALTDLSPLLSSVRNTVVTELNANTLSLSDILATVLDFDYSQMQLTLSGSANIAAPVSQTYSLSIANGIVTIIQPDSTAWDISLNFSNESDPSFVFTDPTTGLSSTGVDLNSLGF